MNLEYEPGDAAAPNAHRAHAWRRYLRFFGARIDDDVDDELRFHFDMLVRDFMSRGMTDTEARAAAARRVGDVASARRDCLTISHRKARRAARANVIDALRQDLAFGFRTLARQRAWTAVIVLTLALGIGASAAIFSVVNTLVLRPFNYPHADRVCLLWRADAKSGMMIGADDDLVRAAAAVPSIAAVEEFASAHVTIVRDGEPSVAGAEWIGRDLQRSRARASSPAERSAPTKPPTPRLESCCSAKAFGERVRRAGGCDWKDADHRRLSLFHHWCSLGRLARPGPDRPRRNAALASVRTARCQGYD